MDIFALLLTILLLILPQFTLAAEINNIKNMTSIFNGWSWTEYYLFSSLIVGICIFVAAIGYALYVCYQKRYRRNNYERISINYKN